MTTETAHHSGPQSPPGRPKPGGAGGRRRPWVLGTIGCALAAVLALVLFVGFAPGKKKTTDVAPGISTAAATLLDLNVLPAGSHRMMPDFTLTDQYGKAASLSQFRGKAVVLSFNDDQCPDLCTLLAQSIVMANKDLGSTAHHVVFLSVNVNPFYPAVSAVKTWTDQHGLGNQANWYFTTGPVPQLRAIWQRYGTTVQLDTANRTVKHSTEMYFIDPAGRERALGSFGTNAANTSLFAHNMAQMANDLLAPSEQGKVGGPTTPPPSQSAAAVGAAAPTFTLPALQRGAQAVSLSDLRGHYVVLNFWSSTCTACRQEMPHIEAAFKALGNKVDVVGIDVSDNRAAAAAFGKQAGATYPLVSDASGSVAGAYQISGLPFTAIVGPRGKLLIRHPGALTTEQLTYVVENLDPALGTS